MSAPSPKKPVTDRRIIPGAAKIVITGTGFTGEWRSKVRQLVVDGLGAAYLGDLNLDAQRGPCTTHLVYRDLADARQTQKFTKAIEYGVPAVPLAWVEESIAAACVLDIKGYTAEQGLWAAWTCEPPERLRAAEFCTWNSKGVYATVCEDDLADGCHHLPNSPSTAYDCKALEADPPSFARPATPEAVEVQLPTSGVQSTLRKKAGRPCKVKAGLPASFCAVRTRPEDIDGLPTSPQAVTLGLSPLYGQENSGNSGHIPEPHVIVSVPIKSARKSTAATYHGCKASDLHFFDLLEVTTSSGSRYFFRAQDAIHGMLVYYDDYGSDQMELAYCNLLHIYQTPDKEIWMEHGYMFDRRDIESHPRGQSFLKTHRMSDLELVRTCDRYHSPASVIEGEFWLEDNLEAARRKQTSTGQLVFYCKKGVFWNRNGTQRRTGRSR